MFRSLKKNFSVWILFILLIVILFGIKFSYAFSGAGLGTSESPYEITNCLELNETRDGLSNYYILKNNIDCSDTINWNGGAGFGPIGTGTGTGRFAGGFNGGNFKIINLYINLPSTDYVGLFGSSYGNISNVFLENVSVTGAEYVGGLVGRVYAVLDSYVTNCSSSGFVNSSEVSTSSKTGGLVGECYKGYITNSNSSARVFGGLYVGGLVGQESSSIIEDSFSSSNVTAYGYVGGLAGYQFFVSGSIDPQIISSYSTGNVVGSNDYVGGLVGEAVYGFIYNSYSTGNVNGGGSYTGGFAGNSGVIESSYATGNVLGVGYVGGFVGRNNNKIINYSYSTGNVNGTGRYCGGFVGYQLGSSSIIENSYATGNASIIGYSYWEVGGFIGYLSSGLIKNCSATGSVYYDRTGTLYGGGMGGFVGWVASGGFVDSCYSTGNVLAIKGTNIGGFVGYNYGEINYSYSTGDVNASNIRVGGFVGYSYSGKIRYSYATGNVVSSSTSTSSYVGGFGGNVYTSFINNTYSRGNATSGGQKVGGFAGQNYRSEIYYSYATGIPSGTSDVGGFSGTITTGGAYNVSNIFWDNQSSGYTTSAEGVGKTTAEMKTEATFSEWDFTNVWGIDSAVNDGYLYLTYFPLPSSDSCSCPGEGNNWEINMGDSCNIATSCNLGFGNITFTGEGITTFNSEIYCTNLQYPVANQVIMIGSDALIRIG